MELDETLQKIRDKFSEKTAAIDATTDNNLLTVVNSVTASFDEVIRELRQEKE